MLEPFLSYLKFQRRCSSHTITSYRKDISQFESFLSENLNLTDLIAVDHSHIRAWIVNLIEQGNIPNSVNRKIASLRAFYKFLAKEEIIIKDPTSKIRILKTQKQLPHFVEEEAMLDLLEEEATEFIEIRNKLILELFYGTGIRLAEIIGIKNHNLSIIDSVIKVLGKRNKERIIPINQSLLKTLKEYIDIKEKEYPLIQHDFLIISRKGEPAYPKLVYRVVKNKLSMIHNLDKRSPHILRHTFATHLLDKGADLNAIKDLLGHSSLAATQIYTHNSIEKLKAIFNQAHPKA